MERFRSWSPSRSRAVTTAVLIVVNVIPIGLLLAGVWRSGDVLLSYWLENVAVGVWNVVQISTARGTHTKGTFKVNGKVVDNPSSAMLATFFCFHYGLFTVVHGVFTGVIIGMSGGLSGSFGSWALMFAAMVVSHGLSTAVHWFGQGERDRVSKPGAMMRPYGRILVLHAAVLGSFFLLMRFDDGTWGDQRAAVPGLLLIGLKLILDVVTHLRRHRDPDPVLPNVRS